MLSSTTITQLILTAACVLITLSIHEYAHGYAAYKLGDNTASSLGRLSLNPLRHLDPFGALCMLFFHFGWAKPVPIDPRNFKKPKKDFAITALAGPLANVILAFISAFFLLLLSGLFKYSDNAFLNSLMSNTLLFIYLFHSVNIGLGIFNLLPIPPFDGSRILNVLLPEKMYFRLMKYERYIYLGVLGWLFLGGSVYSFLMSIGFIASSPVLSAIASVFALSMHISNAAGFLSDAMLRFWQLIPALR